MVSVVGNTLTTENNDTFINHFEAIETAKKDIKKFVNEKRLIIKTLEDQENKVRFILTKTR